jgi:hypothetical protein
MGMHAFRRLREQEAADAAANSIEASVSTAKASYPKPASFNEPLPQKRTRKSSASAASTAEN